MIRSAIALIAAVALAGCIDITLPESHYQREIFSRAVEADAANAHAQFSLGRHAMYEGEYRTAITHFESATLAEPSLVEAWLGIGRCWINLDRPAYALEPLNRALALSPDSARAHELLGQALLENGDQSGSEEHLRRAVEIDPSAFLALAKLGELAYLRGDNAMAIARWREAVACEPSDPEWRNAQRDLATLLQDLEAYTARYPD